MRAAQLTEFALTEPQADILTAENLQLWRGDRRLFEHLSLEVHPACMVHVQGANGAGKTSLLRILCGLAPPDEGQVRWRGQRVERVRSEFQGALAYLGHRDGLKHDLSALENLRFSCGMQRSIAEDTLRAALDHASIANAADLPVRFLSAGQRRRVAFARVTASAAALWLLDEPFANLDAEGTALVARTVLGHLEHSGLVVMTAHRLPPELLAARVTTVALG